MSKPVVIALVTPNSLADEVQKKDLLLADLWELRFDTFQNKSVADLISEVKTMDASKPLLFTVRLQRDGGEWPTEFSGNRLPLWQEALQSGVDWIDIETEENQVLKDELVRLRDRYTPSTQILISHHDFKCSGHVEKLHIRLNQMQQYPADGYKMALTFESPQDELEMKNFLSSKPEKLISCFGMGAWGQNSRKQNPLLGATWTYGYVGDSPSAPGQISVRELVEFYRDIS